MRSEETTRSPMLNTSRVVLAFRYVNKNRGGIEDKQKQVREERENG